ncbi:MAG: DUF5678 domain-containing protein [Nanoarchaeota archaeon]
MKNYNYFMSSSVEKYIGKWIVIEDNKVIASGDNVKKVVQEAREKLPNKKIFVTKVPEKTAMIF